MKISSKVETLVLHALLRTWLQRGLMMPSESPNPSPLYHQHPALPHFKEDTGL